jgi:hypothetical protein
LRQVVDRYLDWAERDLARGRMRKAEAFVNRVSPLLAFASNDQRASAEGLRMRIAEGRRQPATVPEFEDIPVAEDPSDYEAYPQRLQYSARRPAQPVADRPAPDLSGYLQTIQGLVPGSTGRKLQQVSPAVQDVMRLFGH